MYLTFCVSLNLLAQENNAILCSDGIDNNGNGLIDCDEPACKSLKNNGCETCFGDGLSFADNVLGYDGGDCGNDFTDPNEAIGVSDFVNSPFDGFVSLGEGGFIILEFTNNLVANSGDNNPDIWVFEVGPAVEKSTVELRPANTHTSDVLSNKGIQDSDGDGYYSFGNIQGSTSFLDIDAIVTGQQEGTLRFDAIKITDVKDACKGNTPGADIDAVCALASIDVVENDNTSTTGACCDELKEEIYELKKEIEKIKKLLPNRVPGGRPGRG